MAKIVSILFLYQKCINYQSKSRILELWLYLAHCDLFSLFNNNSNEEELEFSFLDLISLTEYLYQKKMLSISLSEKKPGSDSRQSISHKN